MKKRLVILIAIVLSIFAGLLCVSTRPKQPIIIHGYLPARDIAEIKSLIQSDLRKTYLYEMPKWYGLKTLPKNIRQFSELKIHAIPIETNAYGVLASVEIWSTKGTNNPYMTHLAWYNAGRWRILLE